jgi:BirA family transcriptional regulator, biotin operon repressor / biotin---[acetyl-CoA-carboxylase] ligase
VTCCPFNRADSFPTVKILRTSCPNFALVKNSNLLAHPAIKLIQQTGEPIGHPFIELPSVDSTNNYAMGKVHAGLASHGMVILALEQTRGKGQRGKTWNSASGKNITLSAILKPASMRPHQQFSLSMAIALACHDFLSKYLTDALFIKWPNDLYWRDRKAGGILIESICKGKDWLYAVVGIGININQESFPKSLSKAVSLKQATGKEFLLPELARELCQCIDRRYHELVSVGGEAILGAYNRLLYKRGEWVALRKSSDLFHTKILGVSAEGQLLTQDSEDRVFDFGEVEWLTEK